MHPLLKLTAITTLIILCQTSYGQEIQKKETSEATQSNENYLTGNWNGYRNELSASGIDLSFVYKGEHHQVLSGGLEQKSVYLGNIDFKINADFEKLLNLQGLTGLVYFLDNHGDQPSNHVVDAQSSSNIETPEADSKIYEAWIQKTNSASNMSVLFGLYDLNSEFYSTDSSALFFNSSFGIGAEISQTGANGPSIFPYTSPALRFKAEPTKSYYLQLAVFDADAGNPPDNKGTHARLDFDNGQLIIAESAYISGIENEQDLPSKYAFGLWTYTALFDSIDGSEKSSSNGYYILIDQNLTDTSSFFIKYGTTSSLSNQFTSCLTTGFTFTGLIPGQENDRLGIGLAIAKNSSNFINYSRSISEDPTDNESTLELTYRFEAYRGVAIQPAMQWIKNPDTSSVASDVNLAQVRLELNL